MTVTYSSTPWGKIPTVDHWIDLPSAAEYIFRICLVLNSSGVWLVNYHEKGIYYSDGASWLKKTGTLDNILNNVTYTDINGWLVGNGNVIGTAAYTPEDVANKSTNVALGISDILYPTQNAVKTYVDYRNHWTGIAGQIYPNGRADIVGGPVNTHSLVLNSNSITDVGLEITAAGLLTVDAVNYETLVVGDDDIPNKKYVDDLISGTLDDGTAQGQLLFWDNGNTKWTYTETTELFWDDTNKRLGIGTATPSTALEVDGVGTFGGSSSGQSTIASGLVVNEDGGNLAQDDFRVETGAEVNAFLIDASAGTAEFNVPLTINNAADLAVLTAHPTGGTALAIATTQYVDDAAGATTFLALTDTVAGYNIGRIPFETAAAIDDDAAFIWDDTNKRLGIGEPTPEADIEITDAGTDTQAGMIISEYNDQTTYDPYITIRKSHSDTKGTITETPTATELGGIYWHGVNTTPIFRQGAHILVRQSGAASSHVPTMMLFETMNATGQNDDQLVLTPNGRVGIGYADPAAKLDVYQDSSTGARPVVRLIQDDVDQPFIEYRGEAAAADITRSIVAVGDVGGAALAGYVKIGIHDTGDQVADTDFYMPIYTLT